MIGGHAASRDVPGCPVRKGTWKSGQGGDPSGTSLDRVACPSAFTFRAGSIPPILPGNPVVLALPPLRKIPIRLRLIARTETTRGPRLARTPGPGTLQELSPAPPVPVRASPTIRV